MNVLRRAGVELERGWEMLTRTGGDPVLDPYRGYATPDHLVVRGRVLTRLRRTEPAPEASRLVNFGQMASLFFTSEVSDVAVRSPETGRAASSDGEGYIALRLPRDRASPGWNEVHLEIAAHPGTRRGFPVLVPSPAARRGIISDVDDTMMRTGAYSLARNLWTTFTGSALTREIFEDAVALMQRLHDRANPVFYVSSSPWNLHAFLDSVFARAGLVPGPMFLRDLGLRGTRGHKDHKGAAIDEILAANPELPFVLIGDTGQKDAFVYRDAIDRHPGRIEQVILREPAVGAPPPSLAAIEAIEAAGVPCHHGRDFAPLLGQGVGTSIST
jgi:phosphatidate phosphatase APP1